MRIRFLALSLCLAIAGSAGTAGPPDLTAIVDDHIIAGYAALTRKADTLRDTAGVTCSPDSPKLQQAYHTAFDAWLAVSHLRFGPSETDDRAFALAFWPDPRGSTPTALAALIRDEDAAVADPAAFATVSVAARGFYALDFLLFDPQFTATPNARYTCALVQAVTTDIARNAAAILESWTHGYGQLMSHPGNATYRTATEAQQQIFTALSTGLEFTSRTRLGRPMGTFDRPRPKRAEAWRSGRSLRHVHLALDATRDLAMLLAPENADLERAFAAALNQVRGLEDPVFAGVQTPQGRLRVEALQQSIDRIRAILAEDVGPSLGIAAGFNSLDGD